MPYEAHPSFKTDGLESIKLWRYISFSKLVDLLRTNSLFFSNLGHLANTDAQEGLYTSADKAMWNRPFATLSEAEKDHCKLADENAWKRMCASILEVMNYAAISRREFSVNCWHASLHENFAMWKIYAQESGICIQSDFSRLTRSLDKHADLAVYVGWVQYRDYSSQAIGLTNAFNVAVSKRREFSYEAEVRAVISNWEVSEAEKTREGIPVAVDVDTLIETVFVSPYAGEYVVEAAKDVLRLYGLSKAVLKSSI